MRWDRWCLAMLCGLALAARATAQTEPSEPKKEEEREVSKKEPAPAPADAGKKADAAPQPMHRWGSLVLSVSGWDPYLRGADYQAAGKYTTGNFPTVTAIEVPTDPVVRASARAIWILPKDLGALDFQWDSIRNSAHFQMLTPGFFNFVESETIPEFSGIKDDGLADGFRTQTLTKSRRFCVDYGHRAFETARAKGYWHAGLRSIDHSESQDVWYYALAPNLPPNLPPAPDFSRVDPVPDTAATRSNFSSRGFGAGFDVAYAVHPRVSVVSGFSIGLSGGRLETLYQANTYFYYQATRPPGSDAPLGVLTFDEVVAALNDPTLAKLVEQRQVAVRIAEYDGTQYIEDFDVYLGIEGRVYKNLRLFIQGRAMAFVNAGRKLRASVVSVNPDARPVVAYAVVTSRETQTVGYNGFVFGLSYRF